MSQQKELSLDKFVGIAVMVLAFLFIGPCISSPIYIEDDTILEVGRETLLEMYPGQQSYPLKLLGREKLENSTAIRQRTNFQAVTKHSNFMQKEMTNGKNKQRRTIQAKSPNRFANDSI